jgi:two-component system, OmpR family, response regulator RegX3
VGSVSSGDDLVVLLAEDHPDFAEQVVTGLRRHGMAVTHVVTGREALRSADGADVVLLDLALPDLDGTEVCRRLRAASNVPIIVLSGRAEEADRVEALNIGADDYLVKPFGLRELIARIHAVRRRTTGQGQLVLRVGNLELDRRSRDASLHGRRLRLAAKEFDLLAFLMEQPGTVVPRRDILDQVWGSEWYAHGRTLDVHVASVRKKLGDARWIETVRGVGFRLRPPEPVAEPAGPGSAADEGES